MLTHRALLLAAATGHQEAAETSVLEAQARGVPGALLERCRLLWDRDKGHRAMLELQLTLQQQLEAGEHWPATAGCIWSRMSAWMPCGVCSSNLSATAAQGYNGERIHAHCLFGGALQGCPDQHCNCNGCWTAWGHVSLCCAGACSAVWGCRFAAPACQGDAAAH